MTGDATGGGSQRRAEVVELRGHILDAGLLEPVLDAIGKRGADYEITRFDVGKRHQDPSYLAIRVEADDDATLQALLERLQSYGANPATDVDVTFEAADRDGVFPEHFYCTTNLPTRIRVGRRWIEVASPEMDCGIVYEPAQGASDGAAAPGNPPAIGAARTVPMDDVVAGMRIVTGVGGVKVTPRQRPRGEAAEAMVESASLPVSAEQPQALVVDRVAQAMRDTKQAGRKVLWVAGPALVHTGGVDPACALIRGGYMDVLFAGNALATHDIEADLFGTSLGVSLFHGVPSEHGHEHHVRAINRVRRCGSIRGAVENGTITGGIMWHVVTYGIDSVLVASVRDDGTLPEAIRDAMAAQASMRRRVPSVGFALMLATSLHSVATANLLPASVPLVCVDINPASVSELVDRGSAHSAGIVTDVGLFVRELAQQLAPEHLRALRDERAAAAP